MIALLFFIITIIKILSYIPTEFNIKKTEVTQELPYFQDTCTCDLTYKVCDRNCCCDPYCDFSMYGFFDDFFEECIESNVILPESVNSVPICSAEHYVIGDLYNPLSVAYQILKKGMCLKKKEQEFDNNEIKNPEKEINNLLDINSNKQIDSEDMDKVFLNEFGENNFQENNDIIKSFIFPVMAPSGMCMKGYPVKLGEDKTVICSIQERNVEDFNVKIEDYIKDTCEKFPENISSNSIIKKIEIFLKISLNDFDTVNNCNAFIYYTDKYYKNDNEQIISDVTFEVKFFTLESDLSTYVPKKSGNPGYIIGSPIRFGKRNGILTIPFYRSRLFLRTYLEDSCIDNENNNTYEDLILSNSITFENRTLFTCRKNGNDQLIREIMKRYFTEFNILKFGNSNLEESLSSTNCNTDNNDYIIIKIFYQFYGLKQNPQREITGIICESPHNFDDGAIYIEFLFINNSAETKKVEVSAPVVIEWPRNWLYPFRFGTTNYKDKNND